MLCTKTGQLNIYIRVNFLSSKFSRANYLQPASNKSLAYSGILMDVVRQKSGLFLEVRLSSVSKTSGLRLHVKTFLLPLSRNKFS